MKLITVNIEGDKHLESIVNLIINERPDVLCLQEVFAVHLPRFEELGYKTIFLPLVKKKIDTDFYEWGIAICSYSPLTQSKSYYIHDTSGRIQNYIDSNKIKVVNSAALFVSIMHTSGEYRIGTTHFTWTENGAMPCKNQKCDLKTLFELLADEQPHVICGDFNIPRHESSLYPKLIEKYTDNIPNVHSSSLDKKLHRCRSDSNKKHLFTSFMVDYIFTQKPYSANNVRLVFGVSDHAAVISDIMKRT